MKIKTKQNLGWWDFPDTQKVEIDGVEKEIPELTEENFWTLVEDYNKLIQNFNENTKALKKEIKNLKSR